MKTEAKKIWEAWGQANALYTTWASERNINSYQLMVLYAVDGQDTITQKKIAEYTGLSKQTVNTVIRGLKKDGYIELISRNSDRREKQVKLTAKGMEYSSKILTPLYELENNIFEMIGEERIKGMMNDIKLFTTIFEKEMGEQKNEQGEH